LPGTRECPRGLLTSKALSLDETLSLNFLAFEDITMLLGDITTGTPSLQRVSLLNDKPHECSGASGQDRHQEQMIKSGNDDTGQ